MTSTMDCQSLCIRKDFSHFMSFVLFVNLFAGSTATFQVRNAADNEIVFIGETIVLQCEAPDSIPNPTYNLLDGQRNDLSAVSFPSQDNPRENNFRIEVMNFNQNTFFCEITSNGNPIMTEEIRLNISNAQPACYIDRDTLVALGDVLKLSCYRNSRLGFSTLAVWRQIKPGEMVSPELSVVDSGIINQSKRKTSTTVDVNSNDDGSAFECEIMVSGESLTCRTPVITVQLEELTVSISTNNNGPLDKGDSASVTCVPSDSSATVSWQNIYSESNITYFPFGNGFFLSVPETTTLSSGTILTFTCTANLGTQQASGTFEVLVTFPSPTTTRPPELTVNVFPDNVREIGLNEEFSATCQASESGATIIWLNGNDDSDVTFSDSGNSITVSIPTSTTLMTGTTIVFTCIAFLGDRQARDTLEIQFTLLRTTRKPTNAFMTSSNEGNISSTMTTKRAINTNVDPDPTDSTAILYYVIGGIFAVVLVAIIIIIIILICLTQQKQPQRKYSRKGDPHPTTTYNNSYVGDPLQEHPQDSGFSHRYMDEQSQNTSYQDVSSLDTSFSRAYGGDAYSQVSRRDGTPLHRDSSVDDATPYSDIHRKSRRVSIHEEDIYNDSLGWNSEI